MSSPPASNNDDDSKKTEAKTTPLTGPGPIRKLIGVNNLIKGPKGSTREEVPVSSLEGKPVLLLFSGQWCPSCRLFKPKLINFYKKMKDAKKDFEVVYITQDRDEEEFEKAYETMPWLALPLSCKRSHTRFSTMCNIDSVPKLVLVNPRGKIVTTEARKLIFKDPEGDEFPWVPPTVFECLDKVNLYTHDSRKIPFKDIKEKEQGFGLFFAASWVKPCRAFTSKLVTTYMKMREAGNNDFEIILVPIERDHEAFDDYWAEMPFPTIAPGASEKIKQLRESLAIGSVPTLVTVNSKNGEVINRQAVPNVEEDPEGLRFPWRPKELPPISRLYPSQDIVAAVHDNVCCILFVNGAANKTSVIKEYNAAAVWWDSQKNADIENVGDKTRFFIVDEDEAEKGFLVSVLRALSLKAPLHGQAALILFYLLNQDKQLIPAVSMNADEITKRVEFFSRRQNEELGDKELKELEQQIELGKATAEAKVEGK